MKKQNKLFLASAMLCLMFTYSTLAGDTPISNLTDGDTPISNVTASDQSGTNGDSAYEFAKQFAGELLGFFLNQK